LLLAPPLLLGFLAGELVVQVVVQHRQAGTTPAPIFLELLSLQHFHERDELATQLCSEATTKVGRKKLQKATTQQPLRRPQGSRAKSELGDLQDAARSMAGTDPSSA